MPLHNFVKNDQDLGKRRDRLKKEEEILKWSAHMDSGMIMVGLWQLLGLGDGA